MSYPGYLFFRRVYLTSFLGGCILHLLGGCILHIFLEGVSNLLFLEECISHLFWVGISYPFYGRVYLTFFWGGCILPLYWGYSQHILSPTAFDISFFDIFSPGSWTLFRLSKSVTLALLHLANFFYPDISSISWGFLWLSTLWMENYIVSFYRNNHLLHLKKLLWLCSACIARLSWKVC